LRAHSPGKGEARLNRRWELVVLGILVNACLGTVYSWSVFRAPLENVLALSEAQSAIPYSVFLAAFAFSMPISGAAMRRLGTRLSLALGGLLVGAGWISAGLIGNFPALILTYGIVGGLGVGFAYGVPLAVAGSWFPARRGLAMGLTLAGFGVSPFVTAPLAEALIGRIGVQQTMLSFGIAFVAVVVGFSVFFRAGPEQRSASATGQGAADGQFSPRRMLASFRFYALWLCYAIGTLCGLTAIGMTATFAGNVVGLGPVTAAAAVSGFGICNGIGRPIFGATHDKLGTRATAILAFALITAGALLAIIAGNGSTWAYFLGFAVLWLMLGGWLAIAPAATTRLFGAANYAQNYGIMYTAYGVGALAGGAASGNLLERFGTYEPMFLLMIGACVVGAVLAFFGMPGRSQPKLQPSPR
jgi:OFA family oxalate/formate antiporter-like MFS transporter